MFFLGIDLGTSYFKSGIFDSSGKILGFGRFAVPKIKQGNSSQLSHEDFLNTLKCCVNAAIESAGINRFDIVSLSYGSQANSFILLDKEGNELTPFILWNDEQAYMVEEVKGFANSNAFKNTTGIGIGISSQLLINKLKWIQNSNKQLWSNVAYVLTMPDYLCYKLTGQSIVDASTASLTGLLNYHKGCWWHDALKIAGVDETCLSQVLPIGSKAATLKETDNFLGLNSNTLFCAGALDHHVAAVGSGVGKLFEVSESTGTVIAAIEHSNNGNVRKGVCVAKGLSEGSYFRMTFDENGAVALEWYQKNYAPEYSIEELADMAEKIAAGCDGLVALPCANNYQGLKGFQNIKQSSNHGHFVRAIMESTANSLALLLNELQISPDAKIVSTGGGAKSLLWREIKNSLTRKQFSTPAYSEAACLGAAMIAATGFGTFENIYEAQADWLQS
jgi:xylulokinase